MNVTATGKEDDQRRVRVTASLDRSKQGHVSQNQARRGFSLSGQPIPANTSNGKSEMTQLDDAEDSAWVWWTIYIFILLLSLSNLITSIVLCRILRLGPEGLQSLEVLPDTQEVRFWEEADLSNLILKLGSITGFQGEDVEVVVRGGELVLEAHGDKGPSLRLTEDTVTLESVHDLSLIDPASGEVIFSTSDPEWSLPHGLNTLEVDTAEVGRGGLASPLGQDLMVRSDANLHISGAEGVSLEGRQVEIVAKDDITFRSLAGGVELSGGVVLDTVMLPHGGGGYKGEVGQFKLCICMPSGKLFKVAIPDDNPSRLPAHQIGCHSVHLAIYDPCQ